MGSSIGRGHCCCRILDSRPAAGFLSSCPLLATTTIRYVGGTSPRTDQGRGVYTATDIPADVTIPIHQEMSYLDSVPDYVSFFCEDPPENGQKTNLIGDMRRFTDSLPVELKKRYKGKRARLRRTLPPTGKNTGFFRAQKCWQETFGTDDREEAVAIADQKGWELSWTDDDFLRNHSGAGAVFQDAPNPRRDLVHPGATFSASVEAPLCRERRPNGRPRAVGLSLGQCAGQHRPNDYGRRQRRATRRLQDRV